MRLVRPLRSILSEFLRKVRGPVQGLARFHAPIAPRRQTRRNKSALLPVDIRHVFVLGTAMTGKDETMEWKHIETRWAAMTRRIRADYPADRIQPDAGSVRSVPGRGALSATIADSMTAPAKSAEIKTSAK